MGLLRFEEVAEFFGFPTLSLSQRQFSTTRARFPLSIGAPGSGKSVGGICRCFFLSANTEFFGDLSGNYGLIGRQSRTDLIDTTMTDLLELIPDGWIRKNPVKPAYRLELINGSIIQFVPMEDLGRFKSRNLGWAFFEEIDEINEDVFEEVSIRRMRRKYTSNNGLVEFHSCFGVCNPTKNWVYDLWGTNELKKDSKNEKERASFDPNFFVWHSTVYENAENLAPDYIPTMEKHYGGRETRRGRMYLMGEWGGTETNIYDWSDDLVKEKDEWPPLEWPTILGLDHGWGVKGYTVVDFIAIERLETGRSRLHVYDEIDLMNVDISSAVDAIDEYLQFHFIKREKSSGFKDSPTTQRVSPIAVVYCPIMETSMQRGDKNQEKMSIVDTYRQRCYERGFSLPFVPPNKHILPGIDRMQWLMNNKLIDWNPRCIKGVNQHRDYIWEEDKVGTPKGGQMDHHCDGTRMASMYLNLLYHFPKEKKKETLIEKITRKRMKGKRLEFKEIGAMV